MAQTAEILHRQLENTFVLIDTLKYLLSEKDPTGEDSLTPSLILLRMPLGDSLRPALGKIANQFDASVIESLSKQELKAILGPTRRIISPVEWYYHQSFGEYTGQATTTLAYFRMQLLKAAAVAFRDIDGRFT